MADTGTRYTFDVYVTDDYIPKFERLLGERDVGSPALAFEMVLGALLASDIPSYSGGVIARAIGNAEYGEGIAEVYLRKPGEVPGE